MWWEQDWEMDSRRKQTTRIKFDSRTILKHFDNLVPQFEYIVFLKNPHCLDRGLILTDREHWQKDKSISFSTECFVQLCCIKYRSSLVQCRAKENHVQKLTTSEMVNVTQLLDLRVSSFNWGYKNIEVLSKHCLNDMWGSDMPICNTSRPQLRIYQDKQHIAQCTYLEVSAGLADLVDVGQGSAIVLGTVLRQTELLKLLKLNL